MSKYTGKCDFFDWYESASKADKLHVTIIYNNILKITPRKVEDFIQWFPFVGSQSSSKTDAGYRETTFFFNGDSYVESSENNIKDSAIDFIREVISEYFEKQKVAFMPINEISFTTLCQQDLYQAGRIYNDDFYEDIYNYLCACNEDDCDSIDKAESLLSLIHVNSMNRYRLEHIKAFEDANVRFHPYLNMLREKTKEYRDE